MSVGSLPGTSGLDATTVWPRWAKKSRKVLRISATVATGVADAWVMVGCARKASRGKEGVSVPATPAAG